MKIPTLEKKFFLEIGGFGFYLYELYSFFHYPIDGYIYDGSPEIWALRLALLLFVFPILYIFRISYLLGWGDAFSWFLASLNTEEGNLIESPGEEATGLEITMVVNFLLGILIFFRLINLAYRLF
jgi:hypothetical protein